MPNNKIVDELYKTYSFIEENKEKFSEVAFSNLPTKMKKEEKLEKAKKNLTKYMISTIVNDGIVSMFNNAVSKMGIEKAFDFFNMVIESANLEVPIEDLMKISYNKEYKDFYNKLISDDKKINNGLLSEVIENLSQEEDEDADTIIENMITGAKDDEKADNSVVSNDHITDYFRMIKDIPVLERDEEQALIKKYRETNDKIYKDEFIEHNLKLAAKEAVKYKRSHPDVKLELLDLIQEGNMGLMRAFETFDETLGYKFSTYSTNWVRQKIQRAVKNDNYTIRIPVHMGEKISKKNRFVVDYRNKYFEIPSDEEIMKYMEMNEEQYKNLVKAERIMDPTSIDTNIETEETRKGRETSFASFLADEKTSNVEDDVVNSYFGEQMKEFAKEVLTEREYNIILDRCGYNKYHEPMTLEAIGKKYGVTRERIRQIEEKAQNTLHRKNYLLGEVDEKREYTVTTRDELVDVLYRKNMNIVINQYRKNTPNSVFKCMDCNQMFTEPPEDLIRRGSCPYCAENKKQLTKK